MARPADIPEDVWAKATETARHIHLSGAMLAANSDAWLGACRIISDALISYGAERQAVERERAARLIEDNDITHGSSGDQLRPRSDGNRNGLAFAHAIRAGK